jgi:hypothetical protein
MEAERPLLKPVLPVIKRLKQVGEDFEEECPELSAGYKRKKDTRATQVILLA